MTPTASAAPSVRARARARRAAPTSTSALAHAPPTTPSPRPIVATGRGPWSPPKRHPVGVRAAPRPCRRRPAGTRVGRRAPEDDPGVAVEHAVASGSSEPPRPSAATRLPSASPGRRAARCSSLPHCAITAEASTVGRNGPGRTWRPSSSSTTTSSLEPRPRTAVLLGQVDAEPAQLGHLLPEGRAGLGVGLEQGAVRRQRVVRREHVAHGGPELLVLVGDGDRHPCPLVRRAGRAPGRAVAARHYRTARPDDPKPGRYAGRREVELDVSDGRARAASRNHPSSVTLVSELSMPISHRRTAGDPRRPPPAPRARRPHRARRRLALGRARPPASASSAPTASASRPSSRSWRACSCPTRARSGSTRRPPPWAISARSTSARATRRCAPRCCAAPASPPPRPSSPTAAAALGGGRPTGRRPLRRRPAPATRRSRPATSRRASSPTVEQVALPAALADQPRGDALGRAGGARRPGRHPPGPLRRHPARRADQRPRLRRPRPARGPGGTAHAGAW